jgi:hypothetical protein
MGNYSGFLKHLDKGNMAIREGPISIVLGIIAAGVGLSLVLFAQRSTLGIGLTVGGVLLLISIGVYRLWARAVSAKEAHEITVAIIQSMLDAEKNYSKVAQLIGEYRAKLGLPNDTAPSDLTALYNKLSEARVRFSELCQKRFGRWPFSA